MEPLNQKSKKSPISSSRIQNYFRGSLDRIAQRRYTRDLFDGIVDCQTNNDKEVAVTDEEKLLTLLRCFNNFFNKKFDADRMFKAINYSLIKQNSKIISNWLQQRNADNIYVIGRFILHITSYLESQRGINEIDLQKADNFLSLIFSDSSKVLDENLILIFSFLARKGYFRSLIGFILFNFDINTKKLKNLKFSTNNDNKPARNSLEMWISYLKFPIMFAVKWRTKVEEWVKAEAEKVELYGSNGSFDDEYSTTSIMNMSLMSVSSEFSNEDSSSRQTRLFLKGLVSSWCNSLFFSDTFYQYFVTPISIHLANSILINTVPIYLIILALVQPIRQRRKYSIGSLSGSCKTLLIQYKLNANPSLGLLHFLTIGICENQLENGWIDVGQEEAYGIIVCLHICIFGLFENPMNKLSDKRRSSLIMSVEKKVMTDSLKPILLSCENSLTKSAQCLLRIALSGPLDPDVVLPLAYFYKNLQSDLKVSEKCVLECRMLLCKQVAFIRYLWGLCLQSTMSYENNSLSSFSQRRTSDCGDKSSIMKILSEGRIIAVEDIYRFLSVLSTLLECVTFHLNTLYLTETQRKSATSSGTFPTAACSNFLLWPELWNIASELYALSLGLIKISASLVNLNNSNLPKIRSHSDTDTESHISSYSNLLMERINEVLNLIRIFYIHLEKLNVNKSVLPEINFDLILDKFISCLTSDDIQSLFYQKKLSLNYIANSFINESNSQGLIQLCILRQLSQCCKWEIKKKFFQHILLNFQCDEQTPSNCEQKDENLAVKSQRKSIFRESFSLIMGIEEINLKKLKIVTINGVPVITKDFFSQVIKDGMNPEEHLLSCDANQLLYPNPYVANFYSDYKALYGFLGKIFAINILYGNHLNIRFAPFFLDKLMNIEDNVFNINDLNTIDVEVAKNLLLLSKTDEELESFNFRFVITQNTFGKLHTHEVVPDGANIPVTKENKNEYIHRVVEFILDKQIMAQCESFRNGINSIFPIEILAIFSSIELNKYFTEI